MNLHTTALFALIATPLEATLGQTAQRDRQWEPNARVLVIPFGLRDPTGDAVRRALRAGATGDVFVIRQDDIVAVLSAPMDECSPRPHTLQCVTELSKLTRANLAIDVQSSQLPDGIALHTRVVLAPWVDGGTSDTTLSTIDVRGATLDAAAAALAKALSVDPLYQHASRPGLPPHTPESWRVAGTAKVLCSALFVSGRDSAEARDHVAGYFLGPKLDSISEIHIDRPRKLVRLTLRNSYWRTTREAKAYGDQGCVIHQPGKDSVYFKPVLVRSSLPDASAMPWPMGDLLPNTPLPANIDTAKLRQATDAAFANQAGLTAAFIVVHKGRIVAERYANGAHRDMQLESWSMGKSITGTLIGVLIQQGALRLEDPAPIPEWHKTPNDPRAKIRIMDLLRMSSGLRFSRGSPEDIPGYHDHDLIYTGAIDAFQFVTSRPLQFEPNTMGRYRNTDPLILGQIIRDVVRKRREEYLTWPQRALFDRIGIRRQVLETDPYGNFLLSGYDYGTARNWARLGMLYLNDGVWNGRRILPEGFVKFVSTPAPAWRDSTYGGMVWVNARGVWNLPRDAFAFRGAGGQDTYVIPSRDLVVVRMGHFPGSRVGSQDLARALALLMEAIPE